MKFHQPIELGGNARSIRYPYWFKRYLESFSFYKYVESNYERTMYSSM